MWYNDCADNQGDSMETVPLLQNERMHNYEAETMDKRRSTES